MCDVCVRNCLECNVFIADLNLLMTSTGLSWTLPVSIDDIRRCHSCSLVSISPF